MHRLVVYQTYNLPLVVKGAWPQCLLGGMRRMTDCQATEGGMAIMPHSFNEGGVASRTVGSKVWLKCKSVPLKKALFELK